VTVSKFAAGVTFTGRRAQVLHMIAMKIVMVLCLWRTFGTVIPMYRQGSGRLEIPSSVRAYIPVVVSRHDEKSRVRCEAGFGTARAT
jgi:uncharacterized membrane protein